MDEVKNDIAKYTNDNASALETVRREKATLAEENTQLNKTLEQVQTHAATAAANAKAESESALADAKAECARTARKAEELKDEIDLFSNKVEMLEYENTNGKKLVEKKNLFIESLQQSAAQESDELRESIKELKTQLKSKSAELQVFKAKYDRELSVLNEKAKYSETKLTEMTASYEELQQRYEEYLMSTKDSEHNGILSDKYNSLHKDYTALKNDFEQAKLETNEAESNL